MEWEAPAIVLDARPFSEGDAIITVMTEEHGAHRGLVKGGSARAHVATWQRGNFVKIRWVGRLSDQLGRFAGETIHANAAHIMDDALALAMLSSACAVAEGALAEREPHPQVFAGLLRLIARLPLGVRAMPDLLRWELTLLTELGYGLDLSRCAVTGETAGLAFVSPRTGRAVTRMAAGEWTARLLPLPAFLAEPKTNAEPEPADLRDGLRLTGHFLTRDGFGARHRPLPQARVMLYDRFAAQTAESETPNA